MVNCMYVTIPQTYTIAQINSHVDNTITRSNYINGECPVCGEGESRGKKKRFFYFLNDDYMYCHNCNLSWTPYWWIKEVTGMSFKEIKADIFNYTGEDIQFELMQIRSDDTEKEFELPDLPGECVNLRNPQQMKFYNDNFIVKKAKKYCEDRRLFTAINAPKHLYVCIKDNYHNNRLVIPYMEDNNKIGCYVSRSLLDNDKRAKYLIKFNSDKPIFNFNKIDESYPYIFLFEGQIDSMFVKNGVAISGIHLTNKQEKLIDSYFPFHKRIWVFDNYRNEGSEVRKKIVEKLKSGETVFLYDDEFSNFKDLNDFCTKKEKDFVDPSLILNSSYTGNKGILKMS